MSDLPPPGTPPTGATPPPAPEDTSGNEPWWQRSAGMPVWAWLAVVLVIVAGVVGVLLVSSDDDDAGAPDDTLPPVPTTAAPAATTVAPTTEAPTTEAATTEAATTVVSTTLPPTTTEATTTTAAPTTLAPTTAAPTSTEVPASTVPPGSIVLSGTGDEVVELDEVLTAPTVVGITYDGDSLMAVSALDAGLQQVEYVAGVFGPSSGRYTMNMSGRDAVSYLEVEADAAWTIVLSELSEVSAPPWDGTSLSGSGADVVTFTGAAGILDYTTTGGSNFTIWFYGEESDLVVNEIGPVTGSTTIGAGPATIEVDAGKGGEWTLEVRAP